MKYVKLTLAKICELILNAKVYFKAQFIALKIAKIFNSSNYISYFDPLCNIDILTKKLFYTPRGSTSTIILVRAVTCMSVMCPCVPEVKRRTPHHTILKKSNITVAAFMKCEHFPLFTHGTLRAPIKMPCLKASGSLYMGCCQ